MEAIKSYSDLQQSRKLAEILPIESADMFYPTNSDWEGKIIGLLDVPLYIGSDGFVDTEMGEIHAWSLAALLDVLPNNENISTNLLKGGYKISTFEYTNSWFVEYEDETNGLNNCVTSASNPIDACYEMIIKLHELNLL